MRVEKIHIKNFKSLKDVSIKDLPKMAVFLGLMVRERRHCLMFLDF